MNAKPKVFLDTNLLIYAHTNMDVPKQQKVQHIIINEHTVVSTQVFKEAANVLFRKFKFDWQDILKVLQEIGQTNEVHTNTFLTIQAACRLAERYSFSFYDSLIIAAALEAGCAVLYSEDLQHLQVIEKVLTVRNPFV